MVAIIVLALAAAFVALRLYSVLGRRTGHEQPIARPAEPVAIPAIAAERPRAEPPREMPGDGELIRPAAAQGVRAIVSADPSFDVTRFLGGARQAYGMILDAFWKGDEAELARFSNEEVAQAFSHAIAERKAAGHTLENRLVAIEHAVIERARVESGTAHVTVRFDADLATVTRDANGTVVAGSMTDAVPTHDLWTFARTLKSADPDWTLVETDEA